MKKYILIKYLYLDEGGWDRVVNDFDTYQEARQNSYSKDDIIAQVVERTPDYITITEDLDLATRMLIQPVLGRIQKCDIGKRVYFKNGYAQVENNEQFKKRTM